MIQLIDPFNEMTDSEVIAAIQSVLNSEPPLSQFPIAVVAEMANRGEALGGRVMKDILAEVVPVEVWPLPRPTSNPGPYMEEVYNWGQENGFEVDRVFDAEDF